MEWNHPRLLENVDQEKSWPSIKQLGAKECFCTSCNERYKCIGSRHNGNLMYGMCWVKSTESRERRRHEGLRHPSLALSPMATPELGHPESDGPTRNGSTRRWMMDRRLEDARKAASIRIRVDPRSMRSPRQGKARLTTMPSLISRPKAYKHTITAHLLCTSTALCLLGEGLQALLD